VQQFVLKFDGAAAAGSASADSGLIQCIPARQSAAADDRDVTQRRGRSSNPLARRASDEVAISLEDAFVSYLGGNLETNRLHEAPPQNAELVGGASRDRRFLRELRENAKWAALIFAAFAWVVYHPVRSAQPVLLFELAEPRRSSSRRSPGC